MRSYPSRSETRETRLYSAAEKGKLSIEFTLYRSEITKLKKQGFSVKIIEPFPSFKNLYTVDVTWSNAFGFTIPLIVYSYTHGIIETFPKSAVENFAQELYVIAKRARIN